MKIADFVKILYFLNQNFGFKDQLTSIWQLKKSGFELESPAFNARVPIQKLRILGILGHHSVEPCLKRLKVVTVQIKKISIFTVQILKKDIPKKAENNHCLYKRRCVQTFFDQKPFCIFECTEINVCNHQLGKLKYELTHKE